MIYNNKIIYYNNKLNNSGILNFKSYNTGNYITGNVVCGDVAKFQILIISFLIKNIKYKIYGCGSAIASISFISFFLKNKNIYQILLIKNIYISQELNLPPIKLHCSILIENILLFSIIFYKHDYFLKK